MTLDEALRDFTNLVIPTVLDIQRQHIQDGPTSLTNTLRPFLVLIVINCLSLVALSIITKATLKTLNLVITGINFGLIRLCHFLRTGQIGRVIQIPSETKGNPQGAARVVEDDAWTDFSDFQRCGKDWTNEDSSKASLDSVHDALCEAFATLGIKSSATNEEIRLAYLRLMKRYHPDLYMRASSVEQARVNHIVVRVRHAYDILTREEVNLH